MDSPDHSSRGHAEFSPSSLKYVAACPGFKGRSGTNAAAEMGTRIHEALEIRDPSALYNENEVEIYEQTCAMEDKFLEDNIKGKDKEEFNEIVVDVDLDGTSTFGTCDRFTVFGKTAIMGDYKTGVSVIDEPTKNWQAKTYAIGAFQRFTEVNKIIFVFYIPVRNEVLHGEFKRKDLPKIIKEVSDVIKEGEKVRPRWNTGTPHIDDLTPNINCRFCEFEDKCPALGAVAYSIANKLSDDSLPDIDIDNLDDPNTLEQLWGISKILANWAARIKAKAVEAAKEGVEFPSLKLKSMGAARKCVDNNKLLEVIKEFDIDEEVILDLASFPLKKIAQAVGRTAPDGDKRNKEEQFMEAVQAADIIETSDTRYTLS
jgi:CRISPR/Cas system-associated exonuclease Cas4 (RecB family)